MSCGTKIMCNVYRKPVRIHRFPGEATSLGAAIAAGVGVGIYRGFEEAAEIIDYDRSYDPDPVLWKLISVTTGYTI